MFHTEIIFLKQTSRLGFFSKNDKTNEFSSQEISQIFYSREIQKGKICSYQQTLNKGARII